MSYHSALGFPVVLAPPDEDQRAAFASGCIARGFTEAKYGSSWDDKCLGELGLTENDARQLMAAGKIADAFRKTPAEATAADSGPPWLLYGGIAVAGFLLLRRSK